jgi:membrane associated rhomboid family serine protease
MALEIWNTLNYDSIIYTQLGTHLCDEPNLLGVCLATHAVSYMIYPVGLYYGAFHVPKILEGEVWRLATNEILHANILHLGLNMRALLLLGPEIEKNWGVQGFAKIAAMSIVLKGLAQAAFRPEEYLVGLSGVIYGLDGALTAKDFKGKEGVVGILKSAAKLTATEYLFAAAVDYLFGAKISFIAHLSGFVAGTVFGWLSTKER